MPEFTDAIPGEIEKIVTSEDQKGNTIHTVTYLDKDTWLPVTGVWREQQKNHTTGWGYNERTARITEVIRVA